MTTEHSQVTATFTLHVARAARDTNGEGLHFVRASAPLFGLSLSKKETGKLEGNQAQPHLNKFSMDQQVVLKDMFPPDARVQVDSSSKTEPRNLRGLLNTGNPNSKHVKRSICLRKTRRGGTAAKSRENS